MFKIVVFISGIGLGIGLSDFWQFYGCKIESRHFKETLQTMEYKIGEYEHRLLVMESLTQRNNFLEDKFEKSNKSVKHIEKSILILKTLSSNGWKESSERLILRDEIEIEIGRLKTYLGE